MKTTFDPAITGGSNERGVDHSSHLFTFSSEATPSPQLVSLLFHSEKEEGKRGRGACKKKKERGKEEENGKGRERGAKLDVGLRL